VTPSFLGIIAFTRPRAKDGSEGRQIHPSVRHASECRQQHVSNIGQMRQAEDVGFFRCMPRASAVASFSAGRVHRSNVNDDLGEENCHHASLYVV
jgi:hypothetical protein